MKEFLSVNEFSKMSGIAASTLRYWDEIGLFSPAKRDPENNYRYYVPFQIIAVNFITVLSSLNVPLKEISKMEGIRNPENIIDLIEEQENLLDLEMSRLRESYSIIHTRRRLIKSGMKAHVDEIEVVRYPDTAIILGPHNNFKEDEAFYEPFMRFCNAADDMRINLNYPIGGYHEKVDTWRKMPGRPDNFFSIDPTGNSVRAAGKYLVGHTRGYYGEFGDMPERMLEYAEKHSLTLKGPVYVVFLHDEICVKDPEQYLSRISIAIE